MVARKANANSIARGTILRISEIVYRKWSRESHGLHGGHGFTDRSVNPCPPCHLWRIILARSLTSVSRRAHARTPKTATPAGTASPTCSAAPSTLDAIAEQTTPITSEATIVRLA